MFFGRYDYTIDAKGRLNFPAKFRDAMGESFVVLEWVDNCLFALPMEEVERLADKLESDELMDSWAISGDLFSTACEVAPDKQGRILLPAELRAYAGLEKDVTIIGNRNHAEIVKAAQQRAAEITVAAQTEARTLRQTVTDYCENMLRTTEDTMVENAAQVKNIRNSLRQNAKKNG